MMMTMLTMMTIIIIIIIPTMVKTMGMLLQIVKIEITMMRTTRIIQMDIYDDDNGDDDDDADCGNGDALMMKTTVLIMA